jgi:hypothetical protein
MPDFSVFSAVITTAGALLGALGGAELTHRAHLRREEAQAKREEARANQQRKDQRTQARRHAYSELLGTARQLRSKIEFAAQRHWRDLDAKLAAIQEHAESVSLHAAHVELLSPKTAEAAHALASAAVRLAADTVQHINPGYQGEGGQITHPPSFEDFDKCYKVFSEAAAQDSEE